MAAGGTVGLPPPPPPPLLLLLVMMLVMPGTRGAEHCGDGEYLAEGHCCVSCPAGTYVAQHCSAPHSRGICMPCTDGVGYTAHENGLEECLSCRQCKDDQTILRPCTPTHDTECRCKQGYFCPAEDCEICHKCSTMCPEGKEIVQACNATMDLGCGLPDQGSTAHVWILVVISLVALGLLLFCLHRHLKCNKAASTAKDAEKGLESEGSTESLILPEMEAPANNTTNPEGENSDESPEGQVQTSVNLEVKNTSPEENSVALSERGTSLCGMKCQVESCWRRIAESSLPAKTGQNPAFHQNGPSNGPSVRMPANHTIREPQCQIIVKDLSQKELSDSFLVFIKEVPQKKWKPFMRTHLEENSINKIVHNFPNDIEEQSYQMLLLWKNTLGEKQSIIKLLDELRQVDTRVYHNVLNTLKTKNIISKLEAAD
ncbi:tumor necrosis factor receptor superfamily member 10B-like isoform X2 [Strigops habroptila]|uniref:tumor necrosis factor receptor superfamily member 10B-like isoform X2 n=2 Tax=Strigops habroptila TaxID=2489341 RepID=UPI0011CF76AA|nr:tumor necrosis factor receptor superfamily member 10B-like isoform X2 [Strigops habroptila]